MIYELRTYELTLARLADYLGIFETSSLDRVNHIWAYQSVAARIERRTALYNDPAWIVTLCQPCQRPLSACVGN